MEGLPHLEAENTDLGKQPVKWSRRRVIPEPTQGNSAATHTGLIPWTPVLQA